MDIFKLKATLGLDSSEYEQGLKNAKSDASSFGSAIVGGFKTLAKAGAVAIGATTAAVGAIGTQAVKSYANYEQLAGGVEKLYGTASDKVKAYADQAYRSAGMSANAYMETATSFSAALINSLEGDVNKAADMTDVAMKAISDNVNVFGSDFASVQNAFQGFAKQNYTMLDNLKLGYGGTKQEMERLIEDANEYRASIGESADLSIDSFADIVQAIQSVQEAQNIAGTTNAEAMRTIEGSANATKAAWANVITAIGRGEGLSEAISGLTTSLFGENEGEGLINQIIPRIQTVMTGIGDFIGSAAPFITDKLPQLISSVLPSLINAGMELLGALGKGLLAALPTLTAQAVQIVEQLATGFVSALPALTEGLIQVVTGLASGISKLLPNLIPIAVQAVLDIVKALVDNAPLIEQAGWDLLQGLADGLLNALPVIIDMLPTLINSIINSLVERIPIMIDGAIRLVNSLVQALPTIIQALVNAMPLVIDGIVNGLITALPVLIQGCVQLTLALVQALPQIISALIEAVPQILTSIVGAIISAAPMIFSAVTQILATVGSTLLNMGSQFVGNVGSTMSNILNTVVQWLSQLPEKMAYWAGYAIGSFIKFIIELPSRLNNIFTSVISRVVSFGTNFANKAREMAKSFYNNLINNITSLPSRLASLGSQLVGAIANLPSKFAEIGKNIVDGLWNGIKGGWDWLKSKVSDLADSLFQGAKDALGIASPSKKFRWIGEMVDEGLAGGIDKFAYLVDDALGNLLPDTMDISPQLAFATGAGSIYDRQGSYNQTVNIYSPTALNPSEVARQTRNATRDMVLELRGKR